MTTAQLPRKPTERRPRSLQQESELQQSRSNKGKLNFQSAILLQTIYNIITINNNNTSPSNRHDAKLPPERCLIHYAKAPLIELTDSSLIAESNTPTPLPTQSLPHSPSADHHSSCGSNKDSGRNHDRDSNSNRAFSDQCY